MLTIKNITCYAKIKHAFSTGPIYYLQNFIKKLFNMLHPCLIASSFFDACVLSNASALLLHNSCIRVWYSYRIRQKTSASKSGIPFY